MKYLAKNVLNLLKYSLVLLISILQFACSTPVDKQVVYPEHVGDIPFDPEQDDPSFQPCHEDLSAQYYNFGNAIQYEGEKPQLESEIRAAFEPLNSGSNQGYVIIRFMVNCEGKTGRFRMETIDENYQTMVMNASLTESLMKAVQSLNGWKPGKAEGGHYDYYQYLTFKIKDNQIEAILP